MKLLTANFLTCAVKACKTSPNSFPLHFRDAELEQVDMEFNPVFLTNLLPRLEWDALRSAAAELGFTTLPETKPEFPPLSNVDSGTGTGTGTGSDDDDEHVDEMDTSSSAAADPGADAASGVSPSHVANLDPKDEQLLRDLHKLLLETQVVEGKMVCGNCGFEYKIKDGIANFLLPSHLV